MSRINFDTSEEMKHKIKVYTSIHQITIKEFFEQMLNDFFAAGEDLTEEEREIIARSMAFFDKPENQHLTTPLTQDEALKIGEKVRNGESLAKLLGY